MNIIYQLAILALLQKYGCDYGQGFYFGKPADIETLTLSLEKMS